MLRRLSREAQALLIVLYFGVMISLIVYLDLGQKANVIVVDILIALIFGLVFYLAIPKLIEEQKRDLQDYKRKHMMI